MKSKKKVCLIHKVSTLDPRSYYKEGRTLLNSGYDVCIIGLYDKERLVDGIRVSGFKAPAGRFFRFVITNLLMFTRALKEKADVYHFHDLDFVPWALFLKLMTGAKIIYDIHEAHPEYILIKSYLPKYSRKTIALLVYIMEQISAKFFDAIVPNDNYIAKGFKHKRNVVVFNFPTLDFFKINDDIPWGSRKYDLFYHGTLPKYHFEAMMNIAERLNSEDIKNLWGIVTNDKSTVVWAGGEIKRRGLNDNFVFLPYADYLSVSRYLRDARIGIIPLPPYRKFMKNIPLKMFEFMGCGMPMVLSDLPPSRQFINGENCAFAVKPDNFDEYAKAIMQLLGDPKKALEMGHNGKRLVFERFNWNTEADKLLKLYGELTKVAA